MAGKGNNGGDGLVAARALLDAGEQVSALLLARIADSKVTRRGPTVTSLPKAASPTRLSTKPRSAPRSPS